jgi:hypothetical protein
MNNSSPFVHVRLECYSSYLRLGGHWFPLDVPLAGSLSAMVPGQHKQKAWTSLQSKNNPFFCGHFLQALCATQAKAFVYKDKVCIYHTER